MKLVILIRRNNIFSQSTNSHAMSLYTQNMRYWVLFLGLDGAGKTCMIHTLKKIPRSNIIPTRGYELWYGNLNDKEMNLCELGGKKEDREKWSYLRSSYDAIIFVVDSRDTVLFEEAKNYLKLIFTTLASVPIIVVANKQDLHTAACVDEVTKRLGLMEVTDRRWSVVGTSVVTGVGINECIEELNKLF